jgi:hypothetical protein
MIIQVPPMMAAKTKIAVTINWLRVEIVLMSPQSRSFHRNAGNLGAAGIHALAQFGLHK